MAHCERMANRYAKAVLGSITVGTRMPISLASVSTSNG